MIRIQRANLFLMGHETFAAMAGIFLMGKVHITEECQTAATDGLNTKYNPKFLDTLTEPEVRAVVAHENLHKAFRHLTTWEPLFRTDAHLANVACDYVINLIIDDADGGDKIKLPKGSLIDERFRGMDAHQVFEILRKEGRSVGQPLDEHMWEDAQDVVDNETAQEIEDVLAQSSLVASLTGKGGASRTFTTGVPQVDWREVLQEFISTIANGRDYSTWRRPNRRWVDQGIYMPSAESESMGEVVLAIDTSGSVGGRELDAVLSEVVELCSRVIPSKVTVLYWGSEVVAQESYEVHELDNLRSVTNPVDGGGTAPACIPEYMREHNMDPECVIIFSDCYVFGGWGKYTQPVLVISTSNEVADVGKTVKIEV